MNVHVLYVLEDKTSKKKSVCLLSVCLSVSLYACLFLLTLRLTMILNRIHLVPIFLYVKNFGEP